MAKKVCILARECSGNNCATILSKRSALTSRSKRNTVAFPKTQRAQDLLVQAPSPVDEKQLRELHIRLRNPVEVK